MSTADYPRRLAGLRKELDQYMRTYDDRNETSTTDWQTIFTAKSKPEALVSILGRIASIVREASASASVNSDASDGQASASSSIADLVAEVDRTFSMALMFAYTSDSDSYYNSTAFHGPYAESRVPSFAHDDSLVVVAELDSEQEETGTGQKNQDKDGRKHSERRAAPLLRDLMDLEVGGKPSPYKDMFNFFQNMVAKLVLQDNPSPVPSRRPVDPSAPVPWEKTFRPHPLSSPFARFRDESADLTADPSNAWGLLESASEITPTALAVLQGRVEITSTRTSEAGSPCSMSLSTPSGDTLALTTMGGYKYRVPLVNFFHPHSEEASSDSTSDASKNADSNGSDKDREMEACEVTLDLTSNIREMVLHDVPVRKGDQGETLLFVADWKRIKSYRTFPSNGRSNKSRRVHTFASKDFTGPIAVLPAPVSSSPSESPTTTSSSNNNVNKNLYRLGKNGRVAVWDLTPGTVPTHTGTGGGKISRQGVRIIGKRDPDLDTWRDDYEDIEPSTGVRPTSFVQLELGKADYAHASLDMKSYQPIGVWHPHPGTSDVTAGSTYAHTMLCGGGGGGFGAEDHTQGDNYFCHAYDLSRGGAPVARYLGHGGGVQGFSTSTGAYGDPNVFLTWAGDGVVRLFDTRVVLPVLSIAPAVATGMGAGGDIGADVIEMLAERGFPEAQAMRREKASGVAWRKAAGVTAAVLAHPDGIPFVFTASEGRGAGGECVKVWDVRAQRMVYELATGNNGVGGMVWDDKEGVLFANGVCEHDVGQGVYRRAKVPKASRREVRRGLEGERDDGDEDWEDEDEDAEYENQKCWPKRAAHKENYFGEAFDAGSHRIFKYHFKQTPDPTILPCYGKATVYHGADIGDATGYF